jgi:hypothetical protein
MTGYCYYHYTFCEKTCLLLSYLLEICVGYAYLDWFIIWRQLRTMFIMCFYSRHPGSLPIHGDPQAKSALYRDRFLLLSQRLSRHQDFSRPAFESELSQFRSCEVLLLYYPTAFELWMMLPNVLNCVFYVSIQFSVFEED